VDAIDESRVFQRDYQSIIDSLLKMQYKKKENPEAFGGFYIFKRDLKLYEFFLPRLYCYPTIFAISALTLPYWGKRPLPLDIW